MTIVICSMTYDVPNIHSLYIICNHNIVIEEIITSNERIHTFEWCCGDTYLAVILISLHTITGHIWDKILS